MGILGDNPFLPLGNPGTGYQIQQSLRFNSGDTHYLNRTPSSAGNRRTWTWSGWYKRTDLSASTGNFTVFAAQQPSGSDQDGLIIDADGSFYILFYSSDPGGSNVFYYRSDMQLRDPSAWYHIMFVLDTTQAAVDDRCNVWINNEKVVDINTANRSALTQNFEAAINNTGLHTIGKSTHTSDPGDGYLAEVNFIDGTAYTDATAFGEYDDNGVWRPIKYAGSYTGQSWYLKFASGDGTDSSGLSNTWTANNFTPSGTGTDVMSDTPTTNWCTLNPAFRVFNAGNTYTEGNLVATNGTGGYSFIFNSTIPVSSGKWYAECTMSGYTGTPSPVIGIQDAGNKKDVGNELVGAETGDVGYDLKAGKIYKDGNYSYATGYTTATSGDTIGVKLDLDGNTIEFFKNNTSVGAAIPVATGTGLKVFAGGQGDGAASIGCTFTWNFGQRDFEYTPPTGFKALNTSNLPAPEIKDGSDYFNTVLYTGDGSNGNAITGVGFQPDLVWGKCRSAATDHYWVDAVRGATRVLRSNLANIEYTQTDSLVSFDTDGFTLDDDNSGGPSGNFNISGRTYVAWNWLAGGSGSSNTAGSITSTVSANPTAGFSIVSYTGTGSGATVGHGLGVVPDMFITKNRDASVGWGVYHKDLGGNTKYLNLNDTGSVNTNANIWNSTSPTSTVFSVGADGTSNGTGEDMIAYCFAEVEGFSKFGTYTANNSSDGPFAYCGFKPAFILLRSYNGATSRDWLMYDSARNSYNNTDQALVANVATVSGYGGIYANIDFISNGFKLRTSGTPNMNANSESYIFAAFAENPFGGFRTTPVTAR